MNSSQNLFLIGPMGSGKSAVGRALAVQLHRHFYDSDDEIEARTGVDVAFVFENEGESGFRQREAKAIAELTTRTGIVLATGGGAVISAANRRHLGARGFVVYLQTSVDEQLRRIRHGRERPLIAGEDEIERRRVLETLMSQRAAKYEELADLTVETSGRKVNAVVREVLHRLP